MTGRAAACLLLAVAGLAALAPPPARADREGYYYPPVTSEERFAREISGPLPQAGRAVRVGFVTQLTRAQLDAPENPRFVIFAKGGEADEMILIALDDGIFATLYRARAVLAQLTAQARGTEFFVNSGIEARATWFDLAKLLGFREIVVSDGRSWSHRILLSE